MKPLKDVIAALRRDIAAAVTEDDPARPAAVRLEVERVVLSLQVGLLEQQRKNGSVDLSFEVLDSPIGGAGRSQGHTLTIEFKRGSLQPIPSEVSSEPGRKKVSGRPGRLDEAAAASVTGSLEQVFGPPGFDSSARATVFREALSGHSDNQVKVVLADLNVRAPAGMDDATKRVRHRIRNVMNSGPLKSVEAASAVLADILERHTVQSVLQLIVEKWRSQEHWQGEPPK